MALLDHLEYRTQGRAFIERHIAEIRAALARGHSAAAIYRAFVADGNAPPIRERQFRTLIGRWRPQREAQPANQPQAAANPSCEATAPARDYGSLGSGLEGLDARTRRERLGAHFVGDDENPLFNRAKEPKT